MDNIINNIIRLKISVFAILSVIGLYFLWDPKYLLITLIAYFFYAVIGHDIALHRYFTHRSFTCSKPTEMFLFLCGMLANMGSTIHFVLGHRRHHKYTETPYDNLQSANHPFLTWLGYGIYTLLLFYRSPICKSSIFNLVGLRYNKSNVYS